MPVLPEWINFQFTPKIHFEIDCGYKVGSFAKNVGNRIVIITTQQELDNTEELSIIKTSLEKHSEGVIIYDDIQDAATFKDMDSASHFCRIANANCIVAFGGFESINAAKAVALLSANDCFTNDLMLGKKVPKKPGIPLITVPSRPLLGNECSPFFTLIDDKDKNRKYFSHEFCFPALVISDPKIGSNMSSADLSKTGIAILSAAVDSILSKYANEITSSTALRAIELISKNIVTSIREPRNVGARNSIYAASLLAGISQSTSSLGLCYALSLAVTTLTALDVFQAMTILLPHVMEYNLTSSAGKYVMIARALDEDITNISVIEAAIKAVEGIRKIYLELRIPQRLSEYEVKKIDLPGIATLAATYPFLDSLPRELPKNEIETILVAAF